MGGNVFGYCIFLCVHTHAITCACFQETIIDRRIAVWCDCIHRQSHMSESTVMTDESIRLIQHVNVFRSLEMQKTGDVMSMFMLLDLILAKCDKFVCLAEVKDCIAATSVVSNFTHIIGLIECGARGRVAVDVLFNCFDMSGIKQDVSNAAFQNSLLKLKLALYIRAYDEISYFIKHFRILMSSQTDIDGLSTVIDLIVSSGVYMNIAVLRDLVDLPLVYWKSRLEKVTLTNRLALCTVTAKLSKEAVGKLVALLHQLQNKSGITFVDSLFTKVVDLDPESFSLAAFGRVLKLLISKPVPVATIDALGRNLKTWENSLQTVKVGSDKALTPDELLAAMRAHDKCSPSGINYGVSGVLDAATDLLRKASDRLNQDSALSGAPVKAISSYTEADVTAWAKAYQATKPGLSDLHWYQTASKFSSVSELLAVVIQSVKLYNGYSPRDTQLMALTLFIDCSHKGRLGNMFTGDGKSLITAMLAICLALVGIKVDIVTSTKVLAVRDSLERTLESKEGFKGLFSMFGIAVSNNCDDACEDAAGGESERKKRYQEYMVFYGEAGYFQRDILLSKYFDKDIRAGEAIGEVLIMDEVDNMMIDNAVKTLYISHNITDMRHLKDLFLRIWTAVNARDQPYLTPKSLRMITQFIKKNLSYSQEVNINFIEMKRQLDSISSRMFCGKETEIKAFLLGKRPVQFDQDWTIQLKHGSDCSMEDVIDGMKWIIADGDVENLSDAQKSSVDSICRALKLTASHTTTDDNPLKVCVPSTLRAMVEFNLPTWIENAYEAKVICMNDSYIVGDEESQKQGEIIIMDKDTGVEQNSSKWSRGLHQFIQLKHSGSLSNESLKAIYISNMNYFQRYQRLYGMSGTVGGAPERGLLKDTYGVDFFEMPRFKPYRFQDDVFAESVSATREEWLRNILVNIDENMDQQLTYTEENLKAMQEQGEAADAAVKRLTERCAALKLVVNENARMSECATIESAWLGEVKSLLFTLINTDFEDSEKIKGFQNKALASEKRIAVKSHIEDVGSDQKTFVEHVCKNVLSLISSLDSTQSGDTKRIEYNERYRARIKAPFEEGSLSLLSDDLFKLLATAVCSTETSADRRAAFDKACADAREIINEINCISVDDFAVLQPVDVAKSAQELTTFESELKQNEKYKEFYAIELKDAKKDGKRKNCKRAVLVICENIADLEEIYAKVREQFKIADNYHIYKYDRAYRKFEKPVLEDGDIVIATNIAGRGTDLDLNDIVKGNGGLHVILSYMPSNSRVEAQAFGRAARAGNEGSGTYIVWDPRMTADSECSISDLKEERDLREQQRISKINTEDFPRIKLEDDLFIKFNGLRSDLEKQFKTAEDAAGGLGGSARLQIDSLKNHWAIWLNSVDKKLSENKSASDNRASLMREYDTFDKNMRQLSKRGPYQLIVEPGELNKLGKAFLNKERYSEAGQCYDHIIDHFPAFAEIAFYYKALCVIHIEGGRYRPKVKATALLRKSLKLLNDHRAKGLGRTQMLGSIAQLTRNKQGLNSNYFKVQNEGEAQVVSVHINSIYAAVGQSVTMDNFSISGLVGDESQRLYEKLIAETDAKSVLKSFRLSKKCAVARRVLTKDHVTAAGLIRAEIERLEAARSNDAAHHTPEYFNARAADAVKIQLFESISANLSTYLKKSHISASTDDASLFSRAKLVALESVGLLSCRELYKSTNGTTETASSYWNHCELCAFPDVFVYCKDSVLDMFETKLQKDRYNCRERYVNVASFEQFIFTKSAFCAALGSVLAAHEMTAVARDVSARLLGQQDNAVFCGKGTEIKRVLADAAKVVYLPDGSLLATPLTGPGAPGAATKKPAVEPGEEEEEEAEKPVAGVMRKSLLMQKLKDEAGLTDAQVAALLDHLENYSQVCIDIASLQRKIGTVKDPAMLFNQVDELKVFCSGTRSVSITDSKSIKLVDKMYVPKSDIEAALKQIVGLNDKKTVEQKDRNLFAALLRHLGLYGDKKLGAIVCFDQYMVENETHLQTCNDHFGKILLSFPNIENDASRDAAIDYVDFSVHKVLLRKSVDIKNTLRKRWKESLVAKDFSLTTDEFEILRAVLDDCRLLGKSLHMKLTGSEQTHLEVETLLTRLHQSRNRLDGRKLCFKKPEEGSKELFSRFIDLEVIKQPAVNIKLGDATHSSEIGKAIKDNRADDDPTKRMEVIRCRLEDIVGEIFNIHRKKESTAHVLDEYCIGGAAGTKSENKKLDDILDSVSNIVKQMAGNIKTLPEIKAESKDIRKEFETSGKVPPELMDYIHMCFDSIIDIKEEKGFDWDVFVCVLIGLAQIVAGVALEILTGGACHHIAQFLIAEGVGDIIFAVQASINGDFTWKGYAQHKIQSIAISLVTGGIGAFMSSGVKTTFQVAMATKTAITKAILKETFTHIIGAVANGLIQVGAAELSKIIMEELADTHFMQQFEDHLTSDSHRDVKINLQETLDDMYLSHGVAASDQVNRCIEEAFRDLMSGSLGSRVFEQVAKLVRGVGAGLAQAGQRLGKSGGKGAILGALATMVGHSVTIASVIKNFAGLLSLSDDFYMLLREKLAQADKRLTEIRTDATIAQVEEDIAAGRHLGRAQANMTTIGDRMHTAFKEKVKSGFVQPLVTHALMAIAKPIKDVLMSPIANGRKDLEQHIENQVVLAVDGLKNSTAENVFKLTARKKRALEARGVVIDPADLPPEMMTESIENLKDSEGNSQSVAEFVKAQGDGAKIMIVNGKVFGVSATHKEHCSNIEKGQVKVAGEALIMFAANQVSKDVVVISDTASMDFQTAGLPEGSLVAGRTFGEGGDLGHLSPMEKDANGIWVPVEIPQLNNASDKACVAQTMIYLKEMGKTGDKSEAMRKAQDPKEITKFYSKLGKAAKSSTALKNMYCSGSTVAHARNMVGGHKKGSPGEVAAKREEERKKWTAAREVELEAIKNIRVKLTEDDDLIELVPFDFNLTSDDKKAALELMEEKAASEANFKMNPMKLKTCYWRVDYNPALKGNIEFQKNGVQKGKLSTLISVVTPIELLEAAGSVPDVARELNKLAATAMIDYLKNNDFSVNKTKGVRITFGMKRLAPFIQTLEDYIKKKQPPKHK